MNLDLFLKNLGTFSSLLSSLFFIVLGYLVYISNREQLSNKLFLIYTFLAVFWALFNGFIFQINHSLLFFIFIKVIIILAVWINFVIYLLTEVYPNGHITVKKPSFKVSLFLSLLTSLMTIFNLVFYDVTELNNTLDVLSYPLGLFIFSLNLSFLNILSFRNLFIKWRIAVGQEKLKYLILMFSFFITLVLVIIFNFVLPNAFKIVKFIPYSGFYLLPFVITLSYGIIKFKIFNVRIISAVIFVAILIIIVLFEILQTVTLSELILRTFSLFMLFAFGIFLIKSIYKEVEQREKLDQLNRIKSEFLSFASHQVKAPMAVVKGYAELIAEGVENVPEQAKDFAKKIKDSVNNLLELVEEFMDYRRIEEGKLELNFEEIDIVSLIKEIVNKFHLIAKEKNLELSFDTQLEQFIIKGDKMRITQVIQNLIDNALKYTPQGWVRVSLSKDNDNILITVADSGIGMSKELQSKLFGEFVRDPGIKKEIRGTGLGLYIAKNIIEAHQGKIWAESEGEGKGSKFHVKIPQK